MRAVLVVLVILNAGVAIWGFSRSENRESAEPSPAASPDHIRTIHLLSELTLPARAEAACESFGPFEDESDVARTTSEILAKGLDPVVKEEPTTPKADGYLVYIDTASRSEAHRIREELQTRQIDCAIIPTGRLADSLSVGVFQRRELADAHLRRITELGYRADLETLTRTRKVYRVFAPSAACGV